MVKPATVAQFDSRRPRIVLALQGGGALGAYQAGVYEAMHENGVTPDWVTGTSIGAINAAIIAGNPPDRRLERLREFWDLLSHDDLVRHQRVPSWGRVPNWVVRGNVWHATLDAIARGIPGFFSPRLFNPFAAGIAVEPERSSYYDTAPLAKTLRRLINVELLNNANPADGKAMRLTVGAVQVTTAELANFDNTRQRIGIEHILASGALPPGFPPVRIDGKLYWDGGLYSNTPLDTVLDDLPRVSTLCFMVDLWFAHGHEPCTLDQVESRRKEVMFASRSQRHIETYSETHNLRRRLRALYERLPPELRQDDDIAQLATGGCGTTMHIVRLQYPGHDWRSSSKDINFSRGSIEWRWRQGYEDAKRALQQAAWLQPIALDKGVVVHDMTTSELATDVVAQQQTAPVVEEERQASPA